MPDFPPPTVADEFRYSPASTDNNDWTRRVILLLGAYLGIHLVLHLLMPPALGVDEVEQALLAQGWDPGYVFNQPPLYTWLMLLAYQVLGVGTLAHIVLKYVLLAVTYGFFYLSARRVLGEARLAAVASFALLLVAPFGWNVYQGFTHTVLLSAVCAAGFYATLKLLASPTLPRYLLVGVLVGLGMLSKYSFVLFVSALLIACLWEKAYRRYVLDWRLLAAVAAALLVSGPHFWWVIEQHHSAGGLFASTLKVSDSTGYWLGAGKGLLSLAEAVLTYLAPLWLVMLGLFPRSFRFWAPLPAQWTSPLRRLPGRVTAAALSLLVLGVLFAGVTQYKARWMHPVLFLAPLFLVARMQAAGFGEKALQRFGVIVVAVSALVVVLRLGQLYVAPRFGEFTRQHIPYRELAQGIAAQGFHDGTIIAGDEHVGGNLRLQFPNARVIIPRYADYIPPPRGEDAGQCLIVWKAGHREKALHAMQKTVFNRLSVALTGLETIRTVEAPMYYGKGQQAGLEFMLFERGVGLCR